VGLLAICGRQSFDDPRVQRSWLKPDGGKLCKYCVAKVADIREIHIPGGR
jgi:hypothetical protein